MQPTPEVFLACKTKKNQQEKENIRDGKIIFPL